MAVAVRIGYRGLMKPPIVYLAKDLRAAICAGHPWVFDRALRPEYQTLQPGQVVRVADRSGPFAVGYVDPSGPLALRILSTQADESIDDGWVRRRAETAARLRVGRPELEGTNAWRLLHGENDYFPGLVIDRYAQTGVAVFDGAAAAALWRPHMRAVIDGLAAGGVELARMWGRADGKRGSSASTLMGDAPPKLIEIEEHGARFEIDVRSGQKTGFFLDQRANRQRVRALAKGKRVLNVYCYTGGFSVQAALGGAAAVTSVDIAAPAIAAVARHFELNGVAAPAHRHLAVDANDFFKDPERRREVYDVVIVDPPSFAPSEKTRPKGLAAYRAINTSAMRLVRPGGVLVSASCSSHVRADDLIEVVGAAAGETKRNARIFEVAGADVDHPVRAGFREGRYLDCLYAVID